MAAISAKFRGERSAWGKKLSELKSALQKYVRRGETVKALWCARELFSFREAPEPDGKGRIMTNFKHRLSIIFLEDVADITLVEAVRTLLNVDFADEKHDAQVYQAVRLMCGAKKGRVCSHARAIAAACTSKDADGLLDLYPSIKAVRERFGDIKKQNGDIDQATFEKWYFSLVYALHSREDVAIPIAWYIHLSDLSAPLQSTLAATKAKRKAPWHIFDALKAAHVPTAAVQGMYKDIQNTKESFLCWMLPLLAHVYEHPTAPCGAIPSEPGDSLPGVNAENLEFDDYVHDIHVTGAKEGGYVRFALEGSVVNNVNEPIVNSLWQSYYEDTKRVQDGLDAVGAGDVVTETPQIILTDAEFDEIFEGFFDEAVADATDANDEAEVPTNDEEEVPDAEAVAVAAADIEVAAAAAHADPVRETDYEFIVRTQITTSNGKTDVYFAHHPSGDLVVLKGPMPGRQQAQQSVDMSEWKRENGLPYTRARAIQLIPDRWPGGVPLGLRNRVNRDVPAWFLEFSSLIAEPIPTKEHGPTKMWAVTTVVDWDSLTQHQWKPMSNWGGLSETLKTDYVIALLARYVHGIGDLADRNFMVSGGRLYALDEDSRTTSVNMQGELRKNKAALVRRWIELNWGAIRPIICAWKDIPRTREVWWDVVKDEVMKLFDD